MIQIREGKNFQIFHYRWTPEELNLNYEIITQLLTCNRALYIFGWCVTVAVLLLSNVWFDLCKVILIIGQLILTMGQTKIVPICLLSRHTGHSMIEKDKMRSGKSNLRSRSNNMVSFLPKVYILGKDVYSWLTMHISSLKECGVGKVSRG